MGRRRRRSVSCDDDDVVRCCQGPSYFGLCLVFSAFLASLSVAVVRGDQQEDVGGRGPGGGGVKYISRAPKNCPHRPPYCTASLEQEPWTCRPESDCFRRNNLTIQPDSKFVKSDASVNLAASTYYFNTSEDKPKCYHALNLTWTMNPKGIIGFFLRINRDTPSRGFFNRTRGLTFWIDEQRLTPERERENGMVTFYSDCVRLGAASTYGFELFSLHAAPDSIETVPKFIGIGSLATDCDTYPEADPLFRMWDAYTHIIVSESDSSLVKVFFAPASQSLGFHGYDLTVSEDESSEVLAGVYNLNFTCTNFDAVIIRDICPGEYAVKVTAKGGYCPCTDNCSDCARRQPFNITKLYSGECRNDNISAMVPSSPVITSDLPAAVEMPGEEEDEEEEATSQAVKGPNNNTVVNGILIMAFGVIIAIAIIAVAVQSKRCKKRKTDVIETGLEKQTVLVIYAADNAYHCNAVRCLAAYLESRCRCRVQLDQWRSVDDPSAPLDWLLVQMDSVDAIVVVNSEAGWRQLDGDSRNVAYRRITEGSDTASLDDVFLAAVKNLITRYHPQPKKEGVDSHHHPHRLFKVAFPYTDPKYFIDDVDPRARTYRLMDDIEDLCLDVDRPSKQPSWDDGTAAGINGPEHARCAAGRRQLQAAVDQAVGYFQSNADWFRSFYRRETPSEQQTTTCFFDTTPWLSASPVFDSGLGGSAEQIYLGTSFVPPNFGGGYDDDDDDLAAVIGQINREFDQAFTRPD